MVSFFDTFLIVTFPILIASLPVILHTIDKGFEYKFVPFRKEKLISLMKADHRTVVNSVGETKAKFEAVETYFDFEKGCHFVATLLIFNTISLIFAQMEFMYSVTRSQFVTLPLMGTMVILLLIFFKRLADGKLVASDVRATRHWERVAFVAFGLVLATELTFHLMTLHAEGSEASHSAGASLSMMQKTLEAINRRLDSAEAILSLIPKTMKGIDRRLNSAAATLSVTPKTMKAIETRLDNAETTLSVIPKTMKAIETRLDNAETTLSVIPKTLEGIDDQLLDMRIAQPLDLSYLRGPDCRRVQQALQELAGYKAGVDGICDGATNAAARRWQLQERRTIPLAQSAEEIERTLRTSPDKRLNLGQ
jgi:hypothetical protein